MKRFLLMLVGFFATTSASSDVELKASYLAADSSTRQQVLETFFGDPFDGKPRRVRNQGWLFAVRCIDNQHGSSNLPFDELASRCLTMAEDYTDRISN